MTEHRNFWERLFNKTTKEVLEKDGTGKIIGKKTYQYDKYGGIIGCVESSYDAAGKRFFKKKSKTYVRGSNGQYDPKLTVYYDKQERPISQKNYFRNASGMLYCNQTKYTYGKNGQPLETKRLQARYDGGLWTTITQTESVYDNYDHLIRQKDCEYSESKRGLVCLKSKSFVRNSEGNYDPKETIYRDRQGQIIQTKVYERRQTELADKPLLFCKDENFTYPNGEKKLKSQEEVYYFMQRWLPMDLCHSLIQKAKQDEIAKLEAKLSQLKGQVGTEKPKQTEAMKYAMDNKMGR